VVFAVILGTGCGGGVVVDGQIIEGRNGFGGEWGHMPLPWPKPEEYPGPECWCGRKGCLETWIAGPAFSKDAGFATGQATMDAVNKRAGRIASDGQVSVAASSPTRDAGQERTTVRACAARSGYVRGAVAVEHLLGRNLEPATPGAAPTAEQPSASCSWPDPDGPRYGPFCD
jgi:hypothetical protein